MLRPLVPHPDHSPRPRGRADHRPERDPACAGCPQLGLLRALRRAGVAAEGRLSCEPGERATLADAERGSARLVVLAGPNEPDLEAGPDGPIPGARLVRVDLDGLAGLEEAVQRALSTPGATALIAVAPCPLGAPRSAPLAIRPARCNRCGACLGLGCPAIGDPGGEAMEIDPAVCTGCGRCAPLCRGRAIGPALALLGGVHCRPA